MEPLRYVGQHLSIVRAKGVIEKAQLASLAAEFRFGRGFGQGREVAGGAEHVFDGHVEVVGEPLAHLGIRTAVRESEPSTDRAWCEMNGRGDLSLLHRRAPSVHLSL